MSLKNWYNSAYLKKAQPATLDIAAKIRVAKRDLVDSSITDLSDDTKFRLAYEAMVVVAQALLLTEGYRPGSTGSHYYAIESLEYTLGESRENLSVLHAFSKKRHVCQYEIEGAISPEEITAMRHQAERILRKGIAALMIKFPELDGEINL